MVDVKLDVLCLEDKGYIQELQRARRWSSRPTGVRDSVERGQLRRSGVGVPLVIEGINYLTSPSPQSGRDYALTALKVRMKKG